MQSAEAARRTTPPSWLERNLARARSVHARSAPTLAVAAALLLALAAWLSLPRPDPRTVPRLPAVRALLVDLSASVTRCRPAHSAWLREALLASARAAQTAGEELHVITYAADVEAIYGPGPATGFEDLLLGRGGPVWHPRAGSGGDLATDLCAALALARAEVCASGRAAGSLQLYGDGGSSDGEARDAIDALARAGVSVRAIPMPPRSQDDLAIAEVVAPGNLESGAPLALSVELDLLPATEAEARARAIELEIDLVHAGRRTTTTRKLELPPDVEPGADGHVPWSARVDLGVVEDGSWEIEVCARSIDAAGRAGDPVPENDRSTTSVRVGGAIVAALVRSAEMESELGGWLVHDARLPGIETVVLPPEELVSRLGEVDLLISVDVGSAALPGPAIASFVRRGGGWLALDGWRALAAGGVVADLAGGEAAELLPLLAAPEDAADRDVVLLVDGSGSMEGEPFDRVREAVRELALAAAPRDRLELRFFTDSLAPIAFESPRGAASEERAAAASALLAARVPGGATDVLRALEDLMLARREARTAALVLLLTDGHTAHATVERARAVRQDLQNVDANLRVIAIGAEADEAFLATLLLSGETLARSRDLADLGALLARELNAERVRSGDGILARLVQASATSSPLARELADAWRAAFTEPRAIRAHERARLAPLAEELWTSSDGEPLLAFQRVGQGLVAACTGSPSEAWTSFLALQPEILAPLLAALGRTRREPAMRALEVEWERQELVLAGVPPDWPAVLHASLRALPNGSARLGPGALLGELTLGVPERVAGRDPLALRTCSLPPFLERLSAGIPLELELRGADGFHEVLGARAPLPAELRPAAADRLLEELPPPAPAEGRAAGAPHPLAAPFLGLGLALLFLASLGLRGRGQGSERSGRH